MNVYTGAMEKDKQEAAYRMARRMLQKKGRMLGSLRIFLGGKTM